MPVFVQHLSVDNRVLDAFRLRHQPASPARQVVADFRALRRADRAEVEDCDVRRQPGPQLAAIGETEEPRRLRGDPLHCVLEREHLLLAHERAQQIGRVPRIAQHIDVRAAVGDADQRASSAANARRNPTPAYTFFWASTDLSSNTGLIECMLANKNGLRKLNSMMSGRTATCGRQPRASNGATCSSVSVQASGASSRSRRLSHVTGRPLSDASSSSSAYSLSVSVLGCFVIAISITPRPQSRSTPAET